MALNNYKQKSHFHSPVFLMCTAFFIAKYHADSIAE